MLTLSLTRLLDVMLHNSGLQVSCDLQVTVMFLRRKWVVCATEQRPVDQSNDEHLHDHHLLTQHCGAEKEKKIGLGFRWIISLYMSAAASDMHSEMFLTGSTGLRREGRSTGDGSIQGQDVND